MRILPYIGLCLSGVLTTLSVRADYKTDIGYTALKAELGSAVPTGAGVPVTQVEARTNAASETFPDYLPLLSNPEFAGKTITAQTNAAAGHYSDHADGVAEYFYGLTTSIAPGVSTISVYESNAWMGSGYLLAGPRPAATTGRVFNHSYVGNANGSATDPVNAVLLLRLDWLIARDDTIQVVGLGNSGSPSSLQGASFNAIAVGISAGTSAGGTLNLGSGYVAGRAKPDLVAPTTSSSIATPMVSAAAALLVEKAHAAGSTLSKASSVNRAGQTLWNAEHSETIKAVLMAGADRVTHNTSGVPDLAGYRGVGQETQNGLDRRYGAGQLSIADSYHILAAGEQDSVEDGGNGPVGLRGFDYDPRFGAGGGGNATATYAFAAPAGADSSLAASLAWNLDVAFNLQSASRPQLNLYLYDLTAGTGSAVASSTSTVDNTQNLWVSLFAGHSYELRVVAGSADLDWDYALAWKVTPGPAAVPLPDALPLMVSGLAGLGALSRRNRRVATKSR